MTLQRVLKRHSWQYLVGGVIKRGTGLVTAAARVLPDFIIIGAQRSGTTSLFNYIAQNPALRPSYPKETHYFSLYYAKGMLWYRSHFPYKQTMNQPGFVTGEATPYYMLHPLVPGRIAKHLPEIKLIVLLRNPVDRAYSHYQFEVKKGVESLAFEDALAMEETRITGEEARLQSDDSYRSFNYQHFTYQTRGMYAVQIERWLTHFSRERMLILDSDSFYKDTQQTLQQVATFLKLPPANYVTSTRHNRNQYLEMKPELRKQLIDYYQPHNRELYDLIGCEYSWEY